MVDWSLWREKACLSCFSFLANCMGLILCWIHTSNSQWLTNYFGSWSRKISFFSWMLNSIALYHNPDADVAGEHLYVFLFNDNRVTVPWRLAVTTASDALLVCQLDAQFFDADLARFLALCGIPFCTLLAKLLMPPFIPYPDVDIYLPQRPSWYCFTKADYEAYLNCWSWILQHPCIWAAILHGGYLWQLTIRSVSMNELLKGPLGGGSLLAINNDEYPLLLDDKLTSNEMDWLCGMYVCTTGMFLSGMNCFVF